MPTGQKPNIWTKPEFQAQTGGSAARKKLLVIDQQLLEWAGVKDGRSAQARYELLMQLASNCEAYVRRQEAKKLKKETSRFSSRPSQLLITRINATKMLGEQVFRRLAFEMHQYRKVFSGLGNVGRVKGVTGVRSLQGAYSNERNQFLQLKVNNNLQGQIGNIQPMGGSYLHAIHHNILQDQGNIQNYQTLAQTPIPENIMALANTNYDDLSGNELQQLHTFFSTNTRTGSAELYNPTAFMEQVHYIRKYERLNDLILIPFGGKLRNTDGSLHFSDPRNVPGGVTRTLKSGMTVTDRIARREAWVMDEYGNIIAKEIARARYVLNDVETAQFNHSSLAAGNNVMCAGELLIHEGDLYEIDNNSGHYRPTSQMLSNAIQVMVQEYEMDMSKVTRVFDAATGTEYDSVAAFWIAVPPS